MQSNSPCGWWKCSPRTGSASSPICAPAVTASTGASGITCCRTFSVADGVSAICQVRAVDHRYRFGSPNMADGRAIDQNIDPAERGHDLLDDLLDIVFVRYVGNPASGSVAEFLGEGDYGRISIDESHADPAFVEQLSDFPTNAACGSGNDGRASREIESTREINPFHSRMPFRFLAS